MPARRRAFTLVEVLVVLGIIMILAAILLPAVMAAIKNAQRRKATTELVSIKNAVAAYHNDYGKLPLANAGQGGADHLLSEAESKAVLRVITGADTQLNPKHVGYLESHSEADDGTCQDPWDKQYRLVMDSNYDGKIVYRGQTYRMICIAISSGPDGVLDTADDLVSPERL